MPDLNDYNQPVKIADGVFWVGSFDKNNGLHCNPYLIIDGDEAVLIDGGSRPDFPNVMMKILQTGLIPNSINALIYQHYAPDLCGSLPNLENIINNPGLKILSTAENHMLISHYSLSTNIVNIGSLNNDYIFNSGRRLSFIKTPYAHSAGSFVTFDQKTSVLFTNDLFGSSGGKQDLFLELEDRCQECLENDIKQDCQDKCPLANIYTFHRVNFPSAKSLQYAIKQIKDLNFCMLAPQHGRILTKETGKLLISKLAALRSVGIDSYFE